MVKARLKWKKRKSKVNQMKMKANKTRNELKVSNLNTNRLKNEERRKIFIDLLTETSQKRYESTSTRFFFTETLFFLPKIAEMHSLEVMNIFETTPLPYL